MFVFLNGEFVAEDQAAVSVFDRSFLYGDGLFDTIRICNGRPFRWGQHMDRFEQGAAFLKIALPYSTQELKTALQELLTRNRFDNGLARLTLSRGVGTRGYSPKGADRPILVMSLHPPPPLAAGGIGPRWKLVASSFRIPAGDPLAKYKTNNKLIQVVAKMEADAAGVDDAILVNTEGHVTEVCSGNLFWVEGNTICTPPLGAGLLPGITRTVIFELCRNEGISIAEKWAQVDLLPATDAVFVTLTSYGVVPVVQIGEAGVRESNLVDALAQRYQDTLRAETGAG